MVFYPKWVAFNVSCLACKIWNWVGPSSTYKNPSWYNNPSWNSKLSCSFERFWTWYDSFNSPLMLIARGFFPNHHEYGFKKNCHQELWTSLEFEGVQAWKWHHIVGCRLHLPPYVWGMNNKIKMFSFLCWHPRSYVMMRLKQW
jgi:hypothetical protein